MKIVQITPGAGGMYCGGCFRDNVLVRGLRDLGNEVLMVPLYLPLKLEEEDGSEGTPIFFGGINCYLEQKSAWFRRAPHWLLRILSSRRLLRLTSGFASRTRPEDVGDLTVSMLRGEDGNQARELDELVEWLEAHVKPDVINLSNALLIGLARSLKRRLKVPLVCTLQGEDSFLDALNEPYRREAWAIVAERAREIDALIAPSSYYGNRMATKLGISPDRVLTIVNGVSLKDQALTRFPMNPPVWGYFARLCPDKGLDSVVDAFIELKRRPSMKELRLKIGGGLGASDRRFVNDLKARLSRANVLDHVEFHVNPDRREKLEFLASLTVFSVPAMYGEAFGLYIIEAMAAGVPVVQPRHAAFPEIVGSTGGGTLYDPGAPLGLADAVEELLARPSDARELGLRAAERVREAYSEQAMATNVSEAFKTVVDRSRQR